MRRLYAYKVHKSTLLTGPFKNLCKELFYIFISHHHHQKFTSILKQYKALTIASHIDFLYLALTQNLEKHELLLISARKEVNI